MGQHILQFALQFQFWQFNFLSGFNYRDFSYTYLSLLKTFSDQASLDDFVLKSMFHYVMIFLCDFLKGKVTILTALSFAATTLSFTPLCTLHLMVPFSSEIMSLPSDAMHFKSSRMYTGTIQSVFPVQKWSPLTQFGNLGKCKIVLFHWEVKAMFLFRCIQKICNDAEFVNMITVK